MSKTIFIIFTLLFSASSFGAEVVICRKPKINRSLVCIIKIVTEQGVRKKDQVVVYDEKSYWIATGRVGKVKKDHFIALFSQNANVRKGNKAIVQPLGNENIISYDSAFE